MYNNPYIMNASLRGASGLGKAGLFSSIRGINWGSLLGNKPIMNNARTMFKVMGAVREDPIENVSYANQASNIEAPPNGGSTSTNQPMYFI